METVARKRALCNSRKTCFMTVKHLALHNRQVLTTLLNHLASLAERLSGLV